MAKKNKTQNTPNYRGILLSGHRAKIESLEKLSFIQLQAYLKHCGVSYESSATKEQLFSRALNT